MEGPDVERTIDRLLGPGEDEVGCDACFELLDRYVELELEGADGEAAIPGLAAHLAGCPACAEEQESLRALVAAERTS
jgi:hypothetical protein